MRYSKSIFILIIPVFVLSCGSPETDAKRGEDSSPDTETTPAADTPTSDMGYVKFKLDGDTWESGAPGHPDNRWEEEAITDGDKMVKVEAYAGNGSSMAIQVFVETGVEPGTYPINSENMRGFYTSELPYGPKFLTSQHLENPGSITISALDADHVKGSFAFPMRSAGDPNLIKQVTEGSFDVRFTRQ